MAWLDVIGELALGFIIGTFVLWLCSRVVDTDKRDIKTAAVYNAIMTCLGGVIVILTFISFRGDSASMDDALLAFTIFALVVSFWLLKRMYEISFLETLWLVIAMWAVNALVEKVIGYIV